MVKYKTVFFIRSLQDESILCDNIESKDLQDEITRISVALESTQKNLGRVTFVVQSKNLIIDDSTDESIN